MSHTLHFTSHLAPHTSHLTPHTSPTLLCGCAAELTRVMAGCRSCCFPHSRQTRHHSCSVQWRSCTCSGSLDCRCLLRWPPRPTVSARWRSFHACMSSATQAALSFFMKQNSVCASEFFCISSVEALHCIGPLSLASLKFPVFCSSLTLMWRRRTTGNCPCYYYCFLTENIFAQVNSFAFLQSKYAAALFCYRRHP
jgi:hypothetical protein